ncbi:Cardiac-enriched FHL2-interacting protein [Varanus komodoensis]|uniref:Chromosome 10 open reading frame 71 n=1 Tax=Varanus komodoensis TaxID=61221 RepID=A0A8D2L5V4_VARKO|nr:cardiac-enriched FHL2-interacting protein [Varanus komodoensis]XP_044276165.1 cardiac-enriched FHL2-interacting protein [Varanus komodoensis]XP_044276166.1 cardiac-enriched FHL2-interacting protein [Varanus komodoensis]XP_044276167.1 cardiac-enriched FHL2-interacting protein [Varanus komodoensis]XP_044276168.1 cardiac-enriched FHL2-interacting protein [Varanus komodoensis]KAF7247556.1 Cardiac-enriched FHL2-interacting protein [Varanus komodoensis]
MQVNKKHTDGQSDSSSIGSFLDDTDREVCSLTDRAFKSLCVAELEASYTEPDAVLSSNIPSHQFTSKFLHSPWNHVIKKSTDANKQSAKPGEHPTFQRFPKDTPREKAWANISRKPAMPVSGLHSYKHTSKVSSLIKTFDSPESVAISKQPTKSRSIDHPLMSGGNVTFWDGKTILSIQKEFSALSDTCQDAATARGRHNLHKRHGRMDLDCQGARGFNLPQAYAPGLPKFNIATVSKKAVKNRTGKAKELTRNVNFLHSENSAFESWNAHYRKLIETGGAAEITPKGKNLTYIEDTPFFEDSCTPEQKLTSHQVTAPAILERDFPEAFSQKPRSKAALSPVSPAQIHFPALPKAKVTAEQMLLAQVPDPAASVHKIPTPLSLPARAHFPPTLIPQVASPVPRSKAPLAPSAGSWVSTPPEAASQSPEAQARVPQATLRTKKTGHLELKPESETSHLPWRKKKVPLGEMGLDAETEAPKLREGLSDVSPLAEAAVIDSHTISSEPSSPSFNISKLLTPVIPPTQGKQPTENQLLLVTPPLSDTRVTKESDERTLYCSQNNYKSKAPSLLFNLKDIRKRVKSTYSASPLPQANEDRKKIKEQENIKASVISTGVLEDGSVKLVEDYEKGHRASGQMVSAKEEDSAAHLNGNLTGNYLTLHSPISRGDSLNYQNRDSVWQGNLVDVEDSVTGLHQNDHRARRRSPSPNAYFADESMEQEVCMQSVCLQNLKNIRDTARQNTDVGPHTSPRLFFAAEEGMNNNEYQVCLLTGHERKDKRSTSSSEQSFVSMTDQPFNESPSSLMQLFQKACLQESQRNDMSREEKVESKEKVKEERERRSHDDLFTNCNPSANWKCERKKEQSENEDAAQERMVMEKKDDGWQGVDSASEGKSEEQLTPTSSLSFKPNLFMIKDNTFKSSPVTKAVKLPLLRSLSCEEFGSHSEAEMQAYGPIRATQNTQERDLPVPRCRSQQNARDATHSRDADEPGSTLVNEGGQVADRSSSGAEYALGEGLGSFYAQELVGDDAGTNVTSVSPQKDLKGSGKLAKAKKKTRTGKLRPSSASQLNLVFEGDLAQSKQPSPTRGRTNYFKSNPLSKYRGGSCAKKIISQERSSPMVLGSQAGSPASGDGFVDASATAGSLAGPAAPRPDSTRPSAFATPQPAAAATSSVSQPEKGAHVPSLRESRDKPPAVETPDSLQATEPSGEDNGSPLVSGLMGRMAKTAAKPPAVPPKTEKALRRAKKLASRRKKMEAQQKQLQDEPADTTPLPPAQPPLPTAGSSSPLAPLDSNSVRLQPGPPLSPTHSLPAMQRKLLQDPDSGEYFIVDLPAQLKTFYDPESGRYVQVSVPPADKTWAQAPASELPPSPYVLCPSALPPRVSSVPLMASPSQLSGPASFQRGARTGSAAGWLPSDLNPEPPEGPWALEPALLEAPSQEVNESRRDFGKDTSLPATAADVISFGAAEDFVVEGAL